jgi:hypothetical protein
VFAILDLQRDTLDRQILVSLALALALTMFGGGGEI